MRVRRDKDIRIRAWGTGVAVLIPLIISSVIGVGHAAFARGGPGGAGTLPLRIAEAKADNEKRITTSNCVEVFPDGRLHMERRRQVLPNPTAALKIFESTLDSAQMKELEDIIKRVEASSPPDYDRQPIGFNNAPWFSSVTVEFGGGTPGMFGYWAWDQRIDGPSVTADAKEHWRESQQKLSPLLDWFHRIEALDLSPSDARSTQCSLHQSPD